MKVVHGMHFIRKHILRTLTQTKWARFRDMRPKNVDSNLYNYHLKQLIREGYVEHDEVRGYRLSPYGLRFVDHVSMEKFESRWQPKILTMAVILNAHKEILLWPKYRQPFIGMWSLPSGKIHYEDASIEDAMIREISYFSEGTPSSLHFAGVVSFRAYIAGEVVSNAIANIFTVAIREDDVTHDRTEWKRLDDLDSLKMSPCTKEIISDTLSHDSFFFSSYDIDW